MAVHELNRSIGIVKATAMVVGTIIGASIFVQPSLITSQVTTPTAVMLVWAVAGALSLFGALVAAELASAFPETGGVYVFLREQYGSALGFLWGWAMFWSMHSGIIAAIAVVFARYVAHFAPLSELGIRVVAVAAILVLSWINYVGVKQGSVLQASFTIVKVLAILVIIVVGLALGPSAPLPSAGEATALPRASAQDFGLAVVAGLFAYGGWHMVTYAAGETLQPERTIPRALLVGMVIVTVSYIALNAVYFHVLPFETVVSSTRVAADAAEAVMGAGGAAVVSGLVVFSTFGALSGIVLVGPRVYYSMARDGLMFHWLADVHAAYRTPHKAIALQGVWSSVLVFTGTYRTLFTRVIYTEWIFFGLMAAGLILLRKRPDYSPAYRVWGYPVIPAIFAIASALIVLNQLVSDPTESAIGLLLVAAGLPIYFVWSAKHRNPGMRPE